MNLEVRPCQLRRNHQLDEMGDPDKQQLTDEQVIGLLGQMCRVPPPTFLVYFDPDMIVLYFDRYQGERPEYPASGYRYEFTPAEGGFSPAIMYFTLAIVISNRSVLSSKRCSEQVHTFAEEYLPTVSPTLKQV